MALYTVLTSRGLPDLTNDVGTEQKGAGKLNILTFSFLFFFSSFFYHQSPFKLSFYSTAKHFFRVFFSPAYILWIKIGLLCL